MGCKDLIVILALSTAGCVQSARHGGLFKAGRHSNLEQDGGLYRDGVEGPLSAPPLYANNRGAPSGNNNDLAVAALNLLGNVLSAVCWGFLIGKLLDATERGLSRVVGMMSGANGNSSADFLSAAKFLPANVTLSSYELEIAATIIDPASVDTELRDIGGLRDVKRSLLDCASLLSLPPTSEGGKLANSPVRGLLLYGPPGCGKSAIVRALAKKKNLPIVPFSPSTVLRKFVGESSQLTKAVFSLCAKLEPCILFVDEADSLFRTRYDDDSSVDRNLKTEVMTHLDQLVRQGSRVLVVAATNRPQDIDAAIQRRFERSYLIGLPNEQTRVEVFRCLLRSTTCDPSLDLNLCAKATEGYSPSDILNVCKAAAQVPLRELRRKQSRGAEDSGVPRPLLLSDVEEALQSVIPTSWGSSAYNTILKQQQQQQHHLQQQQQQHYPHQSQQGGMGLGDGDAYNAPEGAEAEDEEEDE